MFRRPTGPNEDIVVPMTNSTTVIHGDNASNTIKPVPETDVSAQVAEKLIAEHLLSSGASFTVMHGVQRIQSAPLLFSHITPKRYKDKALEEMTVQEATYNAIQHEHFLQKKEEEGKTESSRYKRLKRKQQHSIGILDRLKQMREMNFGDTRGDVEFSGANEFDFNSMQRLLFSQPQERQQLSDMVDRLGGQEPFLSYANANAKWMHSQNSTQQAQQPNASPQADVLSIHGGMGEYSQR